MATLEISIHCLCHFVPSADQDIVHVLMPATHRHHRHVVRALHPRFEEKRGRSLDGWVLRLGPADAPAAVRSLEPEETENGAVLFDLTEIAGPLDPALIEQDDHPKIAARIDLLGGRLFSLHSEADWTIRQVLRPLSYKAVWRIPDFTAEQWEWRRTIDTPRREEDEHPFEFADIMEADGSARLEIYHVTEDALPPKTFGTLNPREVQEHVKAFYELYGHQPTDDDLPRDPELFVDQEILVERLVQAAREDGDRMAIERLARLAEKAVRGAGQERPLFLQSLRDDTDSVNCPNATGKPGSSG